MKPNEKKQKIRECLDATARSKHAHFGSSEMLDHLTKSGAKFTVQEIKNPAFSSEPLGKIVTVEAFVFLIDLS